MAASLQSLLPWPHGTHIFLLCVWNMCTPGFKAMLGGEFATCKLQWNGKWMIQTYMLSCFSHVRLLRPHEL